ncbi:MAG: KH domain-containing protein, partial [Candidatus Hodarchaeales archaeon]
IEDNRSKKRVERIRGRIIGESGRTRRVLEEITRCNVSIYGDTVAIVGRYEDGEIDTAQEAIELLISGVKHGTVYKFLERYRMQKKAEGYKIWKPKDSFDKMWDDVSKKSEEGKSNQNQSGES